MQQKLLLKTMLLLCALVAGSSSVWAQTTTTTCTFSTKAWAANNGGTWTSGQDGSQFTSGRGVQVTTGASGANGTSGDSFTGVSSIVVTYSTNTSKGKGEIKVQVGSGTEKSYSISSAVGTDDTTQEFTFSPTETGKVKITVTCSENSIYVKSVAITHTSSGGGGSSTVSTPTFSPVAGTYTTAQSVTLGCTTDGATIHYTMTTNGSTPADPTESDATYTTTPISVTLSGTKIKAKAFKDGSTASSVATATYTIKPNKPTVAAAGATVTITGDDGLEFYYTTDGSTTPTKSSTKYTGPFEPGADCTIKARAYDTNDNASDVTSPFIFKYMPLSPKNINSGYYEKVTDASDLENGDAILIVNEDGKVALSTTQNGNNRAKEDIEFLTSGDIYAPSANVQKLVLVAKMRK